MCIPNQFLNTRQSSAWDKILLRLHFVYYVNTWYVCTWKDGQTNRAKLNEISVNGRWNCLIALNIRVGVKFFNEGGIKKYYDKMRCTQTFIFRIASGSLCWIVNSYMREFMSGRIGSQDLNLEIWEFLGFLWKSVFSCRNSFRISGFLKKILNFNKKNYRYLNNFVIFLLFYNSRESRHNSRIFRYFRESFNPALSTFSKYWISDIF